MLDLKSEMKHLGAACCCLAIALACATPAEGIMRRDDRVESDYEELGDMYPAVGELYSSTELGSGCLIDQSSSDGSEWVLTAAHLAPDNFVLGGTTYTVTEFHRHDDWDDNVDNGNDIALARLNQKVTDVAPMLWNDDTGYLDTGTDVVSVGFGLSGTGDSGAEDGTSGTRRGGENIVGTLGWEATGPSSPPDTAFEYTFSDPDTATNVRDLEGMSVSGDSGGIVVGEGGVADGKIVGIHSYALYADGNNIGQYGDSSGSTRVSSYDSWITSTIPEPSVAVLLGGALVVIGLFRRRTIIG